MIVGALEFSVFPAVREEFASDRGKSPLHRQIIARQQGLACHFAKPSGSGIPGTKTGPAGNWQRNSASLSRHCFPGMSDYLIIDKFALAPYIVANPAAARAGRTASRDMSTCVTTGSERRSSRFTLKKKVPLETRLRR